MSNVTRAKPSGWRGKKIDRYWTKGTAYGVKYMCSECGRQQLGFPLRSHLSGCSQGTGTPDAATGTKIIDLFEALKKSLEPKKGGAA